MDLVLDGKYPLIAVVVTDQESNECLCSQEIDILEIRVDLFQDLNRENIQENIRKRRETKIPIILTVRTDVDEGAVEGNGISEDFKFQILEDSIACIDGIDIELTSPILVKVVALAQKYTKKIIISSHNFNNTPQEHSLESVFQQAKEQKADIVKIATQAHSFEDVRRLTAFTIKHANDNIITMALGEQGAISRLTFPAMGSLLTYSFIGKPSAPGQIPLKILREHLGLYYFL